MFLSAALQCAISLAPTSSSVAARIGRRMRSGTLVEMWLDGTVERVGVHRSSGHKVLDDAALRIVKMAAPYSPFPPDIRKDYDVIEITRTWTFTNSDQVRAN